MANGTWTPRLAAFLVAAIIFAALAAGQGTSGQSAETQPSASQMSNATPYQPKFAGDPARSESEAQALGYMRVVLRAQKLYKKKHDKFAPSLAALAGTGSLTKRMAATTDRGDYTVGFKTQKDGFVLTMTPKLMDAQRRSFYAEDDGIIRGDDQKPADATSAKVK